MTAMTGAQAIIKSLRVNGVDTVFALPGGQLDFLFDAMYQEGEGIRLIHSRHEQGCAYMAYGYARSTGKVGTYSVVPGPGLLNSSGALCTAWANYSPVLCISGQIPSTAIGKGYGDLHEIDDQLGMIRHITKWASRIDHPSQAPDTVREAFRQLNTGAPRPVEVEMPMDIMALESKVELLPTVNDYPLPPVDERQIEAAVAILQSAKKPLIYVGSGAIEASAEVLRIAEALQAPVVSFRSGKGIVSDEHYLSANFPMGHQLWGEADAVLAVGTRLHWPLVMWGKDEDLKLIRVDIDPDVACYVFIGALEIVITGVVLNVIQPESAPEGAAESGAGEAELPTPDERRDGAYYERVGRTVVDIFLNGVARSGGTG